jgi:DNA-binding CsgD family transcriptional regulator
LLLDDRDQAGVLVEELAPFAGQTLMAGFTISFGPADRLRSALSQLLDRPDEADRLITSARELAVRARSPVWEARVEQTHSWILARRGDAAGAARHHEAARELAQPIGMRSVLDPPVVRPVVVTARAPGSARSARPDGLSGREGEVLALLAEGCSNRDIAARLLISPNTAANHVRSILQKTGCANRAEAAAYHVRSGVAFGSE